MKTLLSILLIMFCANTFAQNTSGIDILKTGSYRAIELLNDSTLILRGYCKNNAEINLDDKKAAKAVSVKKQEPVKSVTVTSIKKVNDITVHGNVLYSLNYTSYLDTPFAQNDLMQHMVQTYMNVMVKDKYPLTVYATHRRSNSPYFITATDISVQYRKSQMLENIKSKLRNEIDASLQNSMFKNPADMYSLNKMKLNNIPQSISSLIVQEFKSKYDDLYKEYEAKRKLIDKIDVDPEINISVQKLIELKERAYLKKIIDSLPAVAKINIDSLTSIAAILKQKNIQVQLPETEKEPSKTDSSFEKAQAKLDTINAKKAQLIKLKQDVAALEQKIRSLQKKAYDSLLIIKSKISSIKDLATLQSFNKETNTDAGKINNTQKILLSVTQFNLGRTWIDYSELTVKNVSLNGFNIEMNPGKLYVAAAMGRINYRFRDFIIKNSKEYNTQSVALVRAGFGIKGNTSLIFTLYKGRKALLNYAGVNDSVAVQPIVGASVEAKIKINKNNYLVGEFARSSYEGRLPLNTSDGSLIQKVTNFKNNTNQAWSIKLFSENPSTNTKLNGYYRKMGHNFQSFTLNPVNSKQDAWLLKLNQQLWKKRLIVEAAVRKNDFNSPIAISDYSSSTIFKSAQVSLRVPKYPFVSAGYYPSTQLLIKDGNTLYETQYNTLNAIISHTYKGLKTGMNSNVVFTRFYNKGSDTSFIYFNATSLSINHTVFVNAFTVQGVLNKTKQPDLSTTTVEAIGSYQWKNKITVSAGLRNTYLKNDDDLWGGTASVSAIIKYIGTVQFQYDKIYLPTYNRTLRGVDMGRLVILKEF